MRTSNKCIKCGSLAIGHLPRIYEEGGRNEALQTSTLGFIGTTKRGAGPLEVFVCTACGYFETYVKDPGNVPFEKIRDFRWVNDPNAQRGTYR